MSDTADIKKKKKESPNVQHAYTSIKVCLLPTPSYQDQARGTRVVG